MSLSQYSKITADDFNALKSSIAEEVLRRSKKSNFPTTGQINNYGNDNNVDPFTSPTDIEDENANIDIITKIYFQKILDFFKKFYYDKPTKYPDGLNDNYLDELVNINDLIYPLDDILSEYLRVLKNTSTSDTARINNQDCRGNCMGLCTGCSGSCINACTGNCGNDCKRGCNSNCWASCKESCNNSCSTGCSGGCSTCSQGCNNNCSNTCRSSCTGGCSSCGGCGSTCTEECDASCRGTCQGYCHSSCWAVCTKNTQK